MENLYKTRDWKIVDGPTAHQRPIVTEIDPILISAIRLEALRVHRTHLEFKGIQLGINATLTRAIKRALGEPYVEIDPNLIEAIKPYFSKDQSPSKIV